MAQTDRRPFIGAATVPGAGSSQWWGLSVTTYLSICAVYRNEGPYLREWVAFHQLVGVERFYLYNNRSDDDASRGARAVHRGGRRSTIHDWPQWPAQTQAYDDCLKNHRDDSRWIAFIDLDEFLFSPTGRAAARGALGVRALARRGRELGGVRLVGAPDQAARARDRDYVRRTDEPAQPAVKCIVDPPRARLLPPALLHVPRRAARGGREPPADRPGRPFSNTDEVSFERLRVNHYMTKSEEEFRRKLSRVPRRQRLPRRDRFNEKQLARLTGRWDEVEDRTIQMYLPALREELARESPRCAVRDSSRARGRRLRGSCRRP